MDKQEACSGKYPGYSEFALMDVQLRETPIIASCSTSTNYDYQFRQSVTPIQEGWDILDIIKQQSVMYVENTEGKEQRSSSYSSGNSEPPTVRKQAVVLERAFMLLGRKKDEVMDGLRKKAVDLQQAADRWHDDYLKKDSLVVEKEAAIEKMRNELQEGKQRIEIHIKDVEKYKAMASDLETKASLKAKEDKALLGAANKMLAKIRAAIGEIQYNNIVQPDPKEGADVWDMIGDKDAKKQ